VTGRVAALWRHPVKSHGRERLERVTLTAGQTFPWDRTWALAHDRSDANGSEWVRCGHFSIGTKAPRLAGIEARLDETSGVVHLSHPDLPDLAVNPDSEGEKLVAWAAALVPENRPRPARVVRGARRGFTDSAFPSISIMNAASHRAVEGRLGRPLEPERWRGNVWLEGLAPWEEFDWIGRTLRVGTVELALRERILRCLHTAASPRTGQRDTDTLGLLQAGWDHQDFGVYAEVTRSGEVAVGDSVSPL
jgi:uncharacterized protein YcbX